MVRITFSYTLGLSGQGRKVKGPDLPDFRIPENLSASQVFIIYNDALFKYLDKTNVYAALRNFFGEVGTEISDTINCTIQDPRSLYLKGRSISDAEILLRLAKEGSLQVNLEKCLRAVSEQKDAEVINSRWTEAANRNSRMTVSGGLGI